MARIMIVLLSCLAILSSTAQDSFSYFMGAVLLGTACGLVTIGIRLERPQDGESEEDKREQMEIERLREKYKRDLISDYHKRI